MRIAITGTPGTGKTTIGKILSKLLGYKFFEANDLLKELIVGYDENRKSWIVDVENASKIRLPDGSVVVGHLSHYLDVDLVVVLRCHPEELKKRLEERKWPEGKVEENVEAEALGVITLEVGELGKRFFEVDTTNKKPEEVAKEILEIIKSGKFPEKRIDYSWWL